MDCDTEINFKKFHQVIQEYEKLIKELTSEIDVYKSEYEANKTTITTLVSENKELTSRLKEALKITEKEEIGHIYSESDLIDNLKKQLSSLAKEKESVVQLWQTTLKTVDYLEEELRLYEGRTHGYAPKSEIKKLKISYEEQIDALRNKIDESNRKIQETRKDCAQQIDEKTKLLEKQSNSFAEAQRTIKKLEQELKELQENLGESEGARHSLQAALSEKNKQIEGFILREELAKDKVREAVSVVETALMEKDAALLREARSREELSRLSKMLSEVTHETELKAKAEISEIKSECQIKLNELQQKLGKAKEEIRNKTFEIEKCLVKQEGLLKEIEIMRKGSSQNVDSDVNKLLLLEKNLESTFQKLLLSERKNVQLSAEKDGIKADMEQMATHFERDIKSRETEKRCLESKVSKLQDELKRYRNKLRETETKLTQFKEKYKEFKTAYKSKKGFCKKTLSDMAVKNSKVYNEMKSCYKKQVNITKKWKTEAITTYKTLGTKIKQLHLKCKKLKTENCDLIKKILEVETTVSKYQQSLQTLCADVENLNI